MTAIKADQGKYRNNAACRVSLPAMISLNDSHVTFLWERLTFKNVVVIVFAYVVLVLSYRTVFYPLFFSPLRRVPGPAYAGPLLGHVREIISTEPGTIASKWGKAYGPFVRTVGPLGKELLIPFRPEALAKILVADWENYPRTKHVRQILGTVAGYGLLTVTGNEHRQMRRAMNPAFSLGNIINQTEMYFDSIDVLLNIMRSQLENSPSGEVLHVYDWMGKVTLDIICETAFGYQANSLTNPHGALTQAYEALLSLQSQRDFAKLAFVVSIPGVPSLINHRTLGPLCAPLFRWIPGFSLVETLIKSTHTIRELSRGILREKVLESGVAINDLDTKRDVMSLLVKARSGEKHGYRLSDEAMVDQVLTFLGAGHETTATGLTWALWLLAKYPSVQDELRAELAPVFASNPRPSFREMKDLKLLECVVMESLRLMPPVPLTTRVAIKDDWIDGVFVPKGTMFYIPIRAINSWESVWGPDAECFRPSRWFDLPSAFNSTFSFLSFIAGPHACIGKTMAMSEMKAVLAAMVAHFDFRPVYEGQAAKPTAAITMKPEDGMPLLVKLVTPRLE